MEIIADRNDNGRWDTGDFADKRQPEQVSIRAIEQLRANWEVEMEVPIGGLFGN
ncbi:MAG: hypothetical protein R2795_09725 [Saprospiraceae bacterium]